ncbi:ParA family protein [Polaromonas sp.]|uniref:ParA family protein n=1 Tax=Polaromonas sp. TaxID=1869339 RepID=UPI0037C5BA4E
MKSIAFFNNKGGVGKTTLLCNVAGHLALVEGARVLVVDADPQCNATQSLFSDETLDSIYKKKSFTIDSVVKPLALGKGYTDLLEVRKSKSFGVDVLVGDPRLALTEDLLATDWGHAVSGNVRGLRTTLLFRHLLHLCDEYDYVLFDVGPSLGAINRSVLLAVDYFLTPLSTDIFSLKALENISLSLVKWKKQYENAMGQVDDQTEIGIDDLAWRLKFLGYVTQQYTAKRDLEGKPRAVRAFDHIIKKVPAAIKDQIVAKLQPNAKKDVDYVLGTIPTLHSLIPLSQTSRRPIFALRTIDGVVGAHFAKVAEYKKTISTISRHIVANLEDLE